MKRLHTNGKWRVGEAVSTHPNAFTVTNDSVYIAEMFCCGEDSGQAEANDALANATVMAAAADMFEVLEKIVDSYSHEEHMIAESKAQSLVENLRDQLRHTVV